MFISVVVPVRNEESHIGSVLDRLASQDYPAERFEVIVVDGQSTDNTVATVQEFVESHPNVRLLANAARLSSAGRNVGVRAALGDIIVIVDGHCELEDDQFLRKHVTAFDRSGADCLGRPQPLELSGATALQRAIAAARSSWLGHHPASHIYSSREQFVPAASVAVAYRRSVFDRVGYFDESFDACEDYELNTRIDHAGLRCYFTPDVTVRYRPRESLISLFRQLVRYGRGRVRLMRRHAGTISLTTLLPALWVLGCVLGAVVAWFSPILSAAYLGTLATYVSLVAAVSVGIAVRHRDVRLLPCLPLVLATIHMGSGIGILLELVSGRSLPICRQLV
jgi:succinoglycan biosynthesis protein ExoA